MSVGQIVEEGLKLHGIGDAARGRRAPGRKALQEVGLDPDGQDRYPHEDLQRPTATDQHCARDRARAELRGARRADLGCSTCRCRRRSVDLLRDLQARRGLAYMFIGHDLRVVRALSDQVIVMRDGQVVEHGPAREIFPSAAAFLYPGADGCGIRDRGGQDRIHGTT